MITTEMCLLFHIHHIIPAWRESYLVRVSLIRHAVNLICNFTSHLLLGGLPTKASEPTCPNAVTLTGVASGLLLFGWTANFRRLHIKLFLLNIWAEVIRACK